MICFSILSIRLSLFHNLDHKFSKLIMVDSSFFFIFFYIDFFIILYFNIVLIKN